MENITPDANEVPDEWVKEYVFLECQGISVPALELHAKICVAQVSRFGGWLIGSHPACNTVLQDVGVCARHVRMEFTPVGTVNVIHLRTGRNDSVHLEGRWIAPGDSIECTLPLEMQLGSVLIRLHR